MTIVLAYDNKYQACAMSEYCECCEAWKCGEITRVDRSGEVFDWLAYDNKYCHTFDFKSF